MEVAPATSLLIAVWREFMERTYTVYEVLKILKKRIILIISLFILCVGITVSLLFFVLQPIYGAQTQILVIQQNGTESYTWDNTETDLRLINTYNVIIKSPAILNQVIERLDLKQSSEQLMKQIVVSNESDSQVVTIEVEDESLQNAVAISNAVAEVFKEEIPRLMRVDNITILSAATQEENTEPVKPNKLLFISIAALVGVLLGGGVALLLEALDTTIKSERDIEEILKLPIMGVVGLIAEEPQLTQSTRSIRGN